jgi:hypothetical protein
MSEEEEIIVVTTRCIDMAASCSDIDKIKCSECGEMTWLSSSWRGKRIDRAVCQHCFEGKDKYKKSDYSAYVTNSCLNDALKQLKETVHPKGTDEAIKKRMIRYIEEAIGKKIAITD